MAINPSGFHLPEGEPLRVSEVVRGMYTFDNAYDGPYSYFTDRPVQSQPGTLTSPASGRERTAPHWVPAAG